MSGAANTKIDADSHSAGGGWRVLTVAAVLMLVAVGAYWNSFNVPFLLDDALAIDNNPSIRHLGRIGGRSATYLPQVWEQIPDKVEFLNSLAEKAGCAASDWRGSGVTVSIYHVESIKESDEKTANSR